MNQYTKGEWKVEKVSVYEIGGEIEHYYITGMINGKSDRTIADVGCWKDRDNALDDARLISAAPDMYEALNAVIEDVLDNPTVWATARKALAKAERTK